jgi:hypothetical protein
VRTVHYFSLDALYRTIVVWTRRGIDAPLFADSLPFPLCMHCNLCAVFHLDTAATPLLMVSCITMPPFPSTTFFQCCGQTSEQQGHPFVWDLRRDAPTRKYPGPTCRNRGDRPTRGVRKGPFQLFRGVQRGLLVIDQLFSCRGAGTSS